VYFYDRYATRYCIEEFNLPIRNTVCFHHQQFMNKNHPLCMKLIGILGYLMSQYNFVMNFDRMCELCCVLADSSGDVGAEHWSCDNHWPTYNCFFPLQWWQRWNILFSPSMHHATHFITSSYVVCHTCTTTISSIWRGFQAFEHGCLFIVCYHISLDKLVSTNLLEGPESCWRFQ